MTGLRPGRIVCPHCAGAGHVNGRFDATRRLVVWVDVDGVRWRAVGRPPKPVTRLGRLVRWLRGGSLTDDMSTFWRVGTFVVNVFLAGPAIILALLLAVALITSP